MMIIFIALALISSSFAQDDLKQILKSPKATLKLYRNFKTGQGLKYSGSEDRLRFNIFRQNAELVAEFNNAPDESATYELNFLSPMTSEERQRYLGLNITEALSQPQVLKQSPSLENVPTEKLWTNVGAVTEVKDQGGCGSCWSFGAVGGLETRYHQGSGKLRSFSEQEYLDCVYEGKHDGCKGGWPDDAYVYSKNNGGRLAAAADYRYNRRDGICRKNSRRDAMVSMKIMGFILAGGTEAATINALASGSVSVAFEVTTHFGQYKEGIMRDTTCIKKINHAVTAVGYTANFVLAKNSWGSRWGDKGFVKFARNHANCGLFKYGSYPRLSSTGENDTTQSDTATSYRPKTDDSPKPDPKPTPCVDKYNWCNGYEKWCTTNELMTKYCPKTCKVCVAPKPPAPTCVDKYDTDWCEKYGKYCDRFEAMKKHCQKTCNSCEGGDEDECAPGTTRCSDGVCRHEHMC